jgi:hypothetical protein
MLKRRKAGIVPEEGRSVAKAGMPRRNKGLVA